MFGKDGSYCTLSNEVKVGVSRWENYEVFGEGKNAYIIGYTGEKAPHKRGVGMLELDGIPEKIDTRIVLDDFLSLASTSIVYVGDKRKALKDSTLTDKGFAKKAIVQCRKYGLPFVGGGLMEQVSGGLISVWDFKEPFKSTLHEKRGYENWGLPWGEIGFVGFRIDMLRYYLFCLYDTFLKAVSIDNDINISIRGKADTGSVYNPYQTKKNEKYFSNENKKRYICECINECNAKFSIEYSEDSSLPMQITTIPNIISLAFYQLGLLLLSPDGCTIRQCKCCLAYFPAYHGKQKFCINCTPQKYYAQSKRREQKEGKYNGNHKKD